LFLLVFNIRQNCSIIIFIFAPIKIMSVTKIAPTNETELDLFETLRNTEHEQVMFCQDKATGLKAIIAIHNTVLGPGLGGTRMWSYATEADAVQDALRLSRGMTYKASVAGLNLGGAKAVIIGDVKKYKSEALMRKFGRFVNNLNGKYITAEDVGTTTRDMEYVAMETKHVVGLPEIMGGGGDPSPVTAYGTYMGMKASAKKAYGSDSLKGKTVAVQGLGKVGMNLCEYVYKEGAKLYVSNINQKALDYAAAKFDATIVPLDDIYDLDVDIFAPCAMGAVINDDTIHRLKCDIIAGASNNQLKDEGIHGDALKEKGIYYAPDFVINAGGLINVYSEYTGYVREMAMSRTEKIYDTILDIFEISDNEGINMQRAATNLAERRIEKILKVQSTC
jgi:leucine dehydrogenase